ncbi:MAG: hypothetical protein ACE5HO_14460 [bacterium]
MKQKKEVSRELLVRASLKEFAIPPVKDGLVLGKNSPIGCVAIRKALALLTPNHFEHIEFEDEVLSDIIIRKALLNRIPQQKLIDFVKRNIKPLMTDAEILHLNMEIIINLEERL